LSGICGLFNTDGAPVDSEILRRMSRAAHFRGPDGVGTWCSESAGLTQLLLATTLEAAAETQPLVHTPSQTCIVFDGRLDNREELCDRLRAAQLAPRGKTDMELVLNSWLLWGTDCPSHLLGDFAFAIFDRRERRLFCARDIAAVKAFYYHNRSGQFTFGSTLSQVLANPEISRQPNEGMIAELLSGVMQSDTETIYSDVRRLPAGHCLLVRDGQLKIWRYWQISFDARIRYSRPECYQEQFEDILTQAVQCRLRTTGGVGITLSGGKDSPLIAATAQALLAQSGAKKELSSFSIIYPGRDCDESPVIEEIVQHLQLDARYYPSVPHAPLPDWRAQIEETLDLPQSPVNNALACAQRESAADGTHVWLSGSGCASLFGGSYFVAAALLRDGRIHGCYEEFRHQIANAGFRFAAYHLLAGLCWPVLPRDWRRAIQTLRHQMRITGFATETFCRAADIEGRYRANLDACEFKDLAQWSAYFDSFNSARILGNENHDLWNSVHGIEERHPFLDRRLIDFAFAIPDYVNRRRGQGKRLVIEMGKRSLPMSVYANRIFAEAGRLYLDVMCQDAVRPIFETLESADRGWVSKSSALAVYDSLCRTHAANVNANLADYTHKDYTRVTALWLVLAVDLWLRHARF